jgi:hypothetical protein
VEGAVADVDAIYGAVVEALVDNSRVHRCGYSDGWTPRYAVALFVDDDGRLREEHGPLSVGERAELVHRVAAWLDDHRGLSHHGGHRAAAETGPAAPAPGRG